MASLLYNRFLANLMNKVVDLEADTIKVALMDNVHSPLATDNEWADVSANEISGTGYVSGGQALVGKVVTQGGATKWDATDLVWNNATFSAYHAVIYDDTVATDDLIASIDFGGEQAISDGIFSIAWNVAGIITLSEI
jgi:hypothetical protein